MHYKHTQIGHLMIGIGVLVFVYAIVVAYQLDIAFWATIFTLVVAAIVASFATLTVTIDDHQLRLRIGYGIVRRTFALSDITAVRVVRNKWYYGWGVRVWLWPRMTIFNVSGFDAVEIVMGDGAVYRIGTDEPEELAAAIEQARQLLQTSQLSQTMIDSV